MATAAGQMASVRMPAATCGANHAVIRRGRILLVSSSVLMESVRDVPHIIMAEADADFTFTGDEGPRNSTDVRVTECPDRSICCGADNTTCCDEGNGQFILSDRSLVDTRPSSTKLPTIITVTPNPNLNDTSGAQQNSSGNSNQPEERPASEGSNTAAIAGGTVGGVAAIALIIGGILLFLRRRKSTKGMSENFTLVIPDQKVGDWATDEISDSTQEMDGQAVSELAAKATSPVEMDGTPSRVDEIRLLDKGKGRAV